MPPICIFTSSDEDDNKPSKVAVKSKRLIQGRRRPIEATSVSVGVVHLIESPARPIRPSSTSSVVALPSSPCECDLSTLLDMSEVKGTSGWVQQVVDLRDSSPSSLPSADAFDTSVNKRGLSL